jgi:hypothetical protein
MNKKGLNSEQKDAILLSIRERGVKRDGCAKVGITIHELNDEIKLHKNFAKDVREAVAEGNQNLADKGKQYLADVIDGKIVKTDRNAVTSAISTLNAYEPGFKGTSRVEGRVDHSVRVISAVPRPNYEITVSEPKKLDGHTGTPQEEKDKLKALNAGKSINTVEEAIEGEIVQEVENEEKR